MAYEKLKNLVQGNGAVADSININGKIYSNAYANDVKNQEEMRLAIVNSGGNVSYTNKTGTYDNVTNKSITPRQPISQKPTSQKPTTQTPIQQVVQQAQTPIQQAQKPMQQATPVPVTATPVTATPVKDNSAQISDMYAQNLAASQAALKASIQQSMGTYQRTIQNAPGTYQPLRNQVSYAGASSMQNLKEMLANNGQQGGVNRTEQTQVNSNTENNINSLNLQQQSVINEANQAISDLQAQGDIKGAELVAQNASERIRAMIAEASRVDEMNYTRGRDATADNRYNVEYADQRGDVQYNKDYQIGRDVVDDTRYNNESEYNKGRDSLGDIRYENETAYGRSRDVVDDTRYDNTTAYNRAQDMIQNTGKLADGTFTQSGQMNDMNIRTGELQLRELTDPNSMTNQMSRLGLDTALLNFSYLPQQLQAQAQQIAQSLSQGAIDLQTAQTQLNYLPQQLQASLTGQDLNNTAQSIQNKYMPQQLQAGINAQNRSNTEGGSSDSSSSSSSDNGTTATRLTANQIKTETTKMAVAQEKNGTGTQWLNTNKDEIIAQSGKEFYDSLVTKIKKTKTDSQTAYNIAKAIAAQDNGNVSRGY